MLSLGVNTLEQIAEVTKLSMEEIKNYLNNCTL